MRLLPLSYLNRGYFGAVAGAISLLISPLAAAQTLRQEMTAAFSYNPTLQSAQATALQSTEVYNQAVGQTKLQITGTLTQTGVNGNSTGAFTRVDQNSGKIDLSQNLFQGSFDGIPAGVRQAMGGILAAHAGYKSQEMDLMFQVVKAYMGVLRDQGSQGVAISRVRNAEHELRAAQARLDTGVGTRTDVALAEANLAQAEANLSLSQATVFSAQATYGQLIGRTDPALSDPGFPELPATLPAAIAVGLEQHPAIEAAKISLQIAQDAVITTRAKYGLNVAAFGQADITSNHTQSRTATTETYSLGVRASIPLWDSGIKKAAIRSAEQGVVIAQANLENQRAAIRAQIQAAWANSRAQLANLNALIAATSAQEVVMRATQAEFDAGTATFLQVLNAQQAHAESQNSYVRAKSDAVIAAYALLLATGGMTTEALGLPVQHFNTLERFENHRNRTYGEIIRIWD